MITPCNDGERGIHRTRRSEALKSLHFSESFPVVIILFLRW
jgi:hypothetical protein